MKLFLASREMAAISLRPLGMIHLVSSGSVARATPRAGKHILQPETRGLWPWAHCWRSTDSHAACPAMLQAWSPLLLRAAGLVLAGAAVATVSKAQARRGLKCLVQGWQGWQGWQGCLCDLFA